MTVKPMVDDNGGGGGAAAATTMTETLSLKSLHNMLSLSEEMRRVQVWVADKPGGVNGVNGGGGGG